MENDTLSDTTVESSSDDIHSWRVDAFFVTGERVSSVECSVSQFFSYRILKAAQFNRITSSNYSFIKAFVSLRTFLLFSFAAIVDFNE